MASNSINCLLTGFDAFGEHQTNCTQALVEAFPDILKTKPVAGSAPSQEVHITKLLLPTAGKRGWNKLRKALDVLSQTGPALIIMNGLAASRTTLSLERFAMNLKDYRIADNDGQQPQDCPIDKKAADLLRTRLDLPAIKAGLTRAGFPCEISNHAGTYICNELYFRAQQYQEGHKSIKAVLFVHWPEPKDFIKGAAASKKKKLAKQATLAVRKKGAQLKIMEQALVEIVERAALVL